MVASASPNYRRFDIYWGELDPAIGHEIKKTRPCVIISPDDINVLLKTVVIAPYTSNIRSYRFRVETTLKGKKGQIALDQMRTLDKARLSKKLGALDEHTAETLCKKLQEMFAY